ncbi:MAG: hypothetical protein AAGJ46_10165 [Planctomycetota bacterium]
MHRLLAPLVLAPLVLATLVAVLAFAASPAAAGEPIVITVEAEDYQRQTKDSVRRWYKVHEGAALFDGPDGDAPHHATASGGAYLECLPDTRRTHGDKLISGENFMGTPGKMAVLDYRVTIPQAGRYYVWVRAHSTGTEDNGIHVGLNGQWPATGARMQWTKGKRSWFWDSKQRTKENHGGVPGKIYLDIPEPGEHTISFSMREDGFEFDKFLLTTQKLMPRPQE